MMRAMLLCAGLAVAALGVHVSAAQLTRTQQVIVNPINQSGVRAPYRVVRVTSGSCWTHSMAVQRPDAYRCSAGDSIYDPCFAGGFDERRVACVSDIFTHRVIVVRLTSALSDVATNAMQPLNGPPFAIELVNGARCVMITGATSVVAGMRANYECDNGGVAYGNPDTAQAVWTIYYAHSYRSGDLTPVAVRAVYY